MEDLEQCHHHHHKQARGQCAICSHFYCEDCLSDASHRGDQLMTFCVKHQELFDKSTWVSASSRVSCADMPEAGLELYRAKNALWQEKQVACFLRTDYQLDDDRGIIESHIHLMVQEQQRDKAVAFLKENHFV